MPYKEAGLVTRNSKYGTTAMDVALRGSKEGREFINRFGNLKGKDYPIYQNSITAQGDSPVEGMAVVASVHMYARHLLPAGMRDWASFWGYIPGRFPR